MARRFFIATHGAMAGGIKESLDILVGNTDNITILNCFTETKNPKPVIDAFFENLRDEDELIVLTDILMGSINQMFMHHLESRPFHLITGINLPLVLQMVLCFDDAVTEDFILATIEAAKGEIKYVNREYKNFVANQADDNDSLF